MMKKIALCLILLWFSVSANAVIVPNKDYVVLKKPHLVQSIRKIEVLEFFSYHCAHCFEVSKVMDVAAKKWPASVELKRIQVMWGDPFIGLMRLLATIETMGKRDTLHHRIFSAFLEKGVMLYEPQVLEHWIKTQRDINFDQFMRHYHGLPVKFLMTYYAAKTKEYDVQATPTIIVDGKYEVLPASPEHMTYVTNELIAKSQKERRK